MNVYPVITIPITDIVSSAFAIGKGRADALCGMYKKEVFGFENLTVIVDVRGDKAFVIVTGEQGGVILHPRSGGIQKLHYTEYVSWPYGSIPETKYLPGVAGGWRDGKTELTTEYIYPLVDADNASFLVSKEDNEEELLGEFLEENGNYGNLYWWNGDEEDPVFLSWRGTPTRHFRLPSTVDIPCFSILETSIHGSAEDQPVYTAFGTALYQGGLVLADAPLWSWPYNPSGVGGRCLILGACQNTNGDIYIVTQSDHYNAPENVFIFSDGHREEGAASLKNIYLTGKPDVTCVFEKALTKPGFFLTLWKDGGVVNGWSFISEHTYIRNGLPWFGDTDGTQFICSNGDKLNTNGTLVYHTETLGTWKETGISTVATSLVFKSTYRGTFFSEYDYDKVTASNVSLLFESSSDINGSTDPLSFVTGVFDVFVPNLPSLQFTAPAYWGIGQCFSVINGMPVVWSAIGGAIDGNGCITANGVCSVMATDCNNQVATASNPLLGMQVSIAGDVVASINSAYTMVNGVYPVTWGMTGGSINSDGVVTSINCANDSQIRGTDACGRTATKSVRTPGMVSYIISSEIAPLGRWTCSSKECNLVMDNGTTITYETHICCKITEGNHYLGTGIACGAISDCVGILGWGPVIYSRTVIGYVCP